MPSKRSFFNATLFKKHLSRFWPLWGGVSLVGALFPLYLLLALIQRTAGVIEGDIFREGLYQISACFVPAFTFAYAILCVMAVWGYLYNARSVGLMHTLPVDRTCLFLTNTLAALAMALIPFAVTGGLLCLIALGWGFFDLVAVLNTVLAVLFCTLLFIGLATLCAMLTGHTFVLPVFYLLFNFLAFLMEILTTSLAHEFLIGVPMMEGTGRLSFLSPIVKIYNSFSVYIERPARGVSIIRLQGLWVVALYALAGLALLALSWLLYKRQHSESAGDVVAFRWLRPIFRYGVALLSALTIGRLLYELMWRPLFQRGDHAQALPMAVCLFLGGLIGYYAASMLLAKSRRVFGKKSLPGVGIVAVGAAALCLLVSVDVFGLERNIPEPDEIASVSLVDRGIESGPYSIADDPDQASALLALHRAIVDDRAYIRSYVPDWDQEEGKAFSHYLYLTYRLKDGSTLRREYDLWLTRGRVETAGTYDSMLAAFYQDPVVRLSDVTIPKGAELDSIDIFCAYGGGGSIYTNTADHAEGDDRETRQIYAALQKDGAEGNIPAKDVLCRSNAAREFYLDLRYFTLNRDADSFYYHSKTVYLAPSMTNTIEALIELGYVTVEYVERWKEELAEQETTGTEIYGDVVYAETSTVPAG
ncbi:MAG: hypothetical protein K2O45_01825 [Oscillospiraceae bacterium]|nr:hypothetical protein [Oscillospiraceae bacterium]